MARKSQAWKDFERAFAKLLVFFGLDAYRKTRGQDWGKSDFDVEIKDHPNFKFDCKYSIKRWKTSSMLETVREKYCNDPPRVTPEGLDGDIPILLCKNYREPGSKATLDTDVLVFLLAYYLKDKK
jgi:hypothetical protein